MASSPEHLQRMRAQVFAAVAACCHDHQVAEAAQSVASELVGNRVRLCGQWAPVIVTVRGDDSVCVQVHDPHGTCVPTRAATWPDNAQAEFGRGL